MPDRLVLLLKDGTKELVDAPDERLGHKHINEWLDLPYRYGCEWNIEPILDRYMRKGEFVIGEWGTGYNEANLESGRVRKIIPAKAVERIISVAECNNNCNNCNLRFKCWTSRE